MSRKYSRCEKNDAGWYAIRDPAVRRKWRDDLSAAQGGRCALCGHFFPSEDANDAIRKQFAPTFDHIVRYASGGSSELSNLRLVHSACNSARESGQTVGVPRFLRASDAFQNSASTPNSCGVALRLQPQRRSPLT